MPGHGEMSRMLIAIHMRTGLVAVVSEAGVEPRRAVRQRAWLRCRLDSSRANESCRWTEMPLKGLSALIR